MHDAMGLQEGLIYVESNLVAHYKANQESFAIELANGPKRKEESVVRVAEFNDFVSSIHQAIKDRKHFLKGFSVDRTQQSVEELVSFLQRCNQAIRQGEQLIFGIQIEV